MDVRLKKEKDFKKVFEKGKRVYTGSMTAYVLPGGRTAFGVSVGKRHGKSVARNRIKRLIREAYRQTAKTYDAPFTVVIVPKVREEYSYGVFLSDMQVIFKKSGAVKVENAEKTNEESSLL